MPQAEGRPYTPPWYMVPVRVLLITFLLTLLSFAISLLLGIVVVAISSRIRGAHPNMSLAYRHFAIPAAIVVAVIVLISATVVEVRHYRQAKALAEIARASDSSL
jgi:ABC-type dipeptide/oligopeptide/nickel transport system permease component